MNISDADKKLFEKGREVSKFFGRILLSESVNNLVKIRTARINMLLDMKENCNEFYEVTRYIPIAIFTFWEYFFKLTYYMLLKHRVIQIKNQKNQFDRLEEMREFLKNVPKIREEFFMINKNKFVAYNKQFSRDSVLEKFINEAFSGTLNNEKFLQLKNNIISTLERIKFLRNQFAHESFFYDANYIKYLQLMDIWANVINTITEIQDLCNTKYQNILEKPIQDEEDFLK